jgi:indolepyruvate ferredoxin oxidoreductase
MNEDLAATAVWGTQQTNLYKDAKYDGVFSMWYGKGPGVDRCGDVFKHANNAGSAKHGGVLVLAGDDHAAKSSSTAHQSDHILNACGIPVLYPSSVQEYIDYGLHAWAMSRYTGLWVSMKCVTDIIESAPWSTSTRTACRSAADRLHAAEGGLNIRWPDAVLDQEVRMNSTSGTRRWPMRVPTSSTRSSGTARGRRSASSRPANPTSTRARRWPTSASTSRQRRHRHPPVQDRHDLAARSGRRARIRRGLDEILVVEEKRQSWNTRSRKSCTTCRTAASARGRQVRRHRRMANKNGTGHGDWLLPATYELNPALIARAIAAHLALLRRPPGRAARQGTHRLPRSEGAGAQERPGLKANPETDRTPYFCSGCPHNTSTKVPEGSRALAGIGCHYMVLWMDRETSTFTHMGAEGVTWVGQAPFTSEKHVFTNLGDGTYFHSGILAIRAAVAAKVNITYKILYNDAVAMTGGQDVRRSARSGHDQPPDRGRRRGPIIVVTDEPEKYPDDYAWAAGVTVRHRRTDGRAARAARLPGVSAMIYDQTCASEKRRRRKRKANIPDPAKRAVINEAVCEGCGDCSVQSNCLSVEPLETELGRKRQINQSSCNKDFSCVTGFCPSFVTVEGGA